MPLDYLTKQYMLATSEKMLYNYQFPNKFLQYKQADGNNTYIFRFKIF